MTLFLLQHGFQLYRNFVQYVLGHGDGLPPPPCDTSRTASNANCLNVADLKSTADHQSVSDADIEQPPAPYELQKDCQMNTLRRGSGDSSRNSLARNQDVASTSKIKAQIPMTPQTARLLSTQQPSFTQTLPRSMSRGGTEPPKQSLNGHQRVPSTPFNEMPRPQTGLENHPGFPWQQTEPENHPGFPRQQTGLEHHPGFPRQQTGLESHPGFRAPSPDLPPPPPEFLSSPQDFSPPVPYSSATLRSPTTRKAEPPPPPRRNQGTKLSFHGRRSNVVQTKNFILNLQRAIGQKQHHGAEGICQLEFPLPPPPVYSDDPSYLDLGDLPPPPAELLEELKVMRRKSKQPPPTLAKQSTLRSTKLR